MKREGGGTKSAARRRRFCLVSEIAYSNEAVTSA
jgi:hypothetical protein